jgi:UV DNA damage endonuclease
MSDIMNDIQKRNLVMGYCCLNVYLRNMGIFTSRTCRLQTIQEKGLEYAYKLAHQNLDDLAVIFKWNYKNNIYNYRMSSEIFPFASHPDYCNIFNFDQFSEKLKLLGEYAKRCKQIITFHPGQYNQLSSQNPRVIEHSIIDINVHAKVLDMMDAGKDSIIVIHGGSKQDGKENALNRFKESYKRLSESAQRRLVLENCEMVYSVEDLLPISRELCIPIVLDYHHHNINPGTQDLMILTKSVIEIWEKKGITPLFHLSESRDGVKETDSLTVRRAHSDYINKLPDALLEILKSTKIHLDIEAKQKEQSVFRLYKKYNLNKVNQKYIL